MLQNPQEMRAPFPGPVSYSIRAVGHVPEAAPRHCDVADKPLMLGSGSRPAHRGSEGVQHSAPPAPLIAHPGAPANAEDSSSKKLTGEPARPDTCQARTDCGRNRVPGEAEQQASRGASGARGEAGGGAPCGPQRAQLSLPLRGFSGGTGSRPGSTLGFETIGERGWWTGVNFLSSPNPNPFFTILCTKLEYLFSFTNY